MAWLVVAIRRSPNGMTDDTKREAHRSCLRRICRRRCALARPGPEVERDHRAGRDVGFAKSGFALPSHAG